MHVCGNDPAKFMHAFHALRQSRWLAYIAKYSTRHVKGAMDLHGVVGKVARVGTGAGSTGPESHEVVCFHMSSRRNGGPPEHDSSSLRACRLVCEAEYASLVNDAS